MSEVFKRILLDDIDIPSRPDIVHKVLVVLEDEYSSVARLEKVILEDPAITSIILKMANAPLYATGKSLNTISESIMAIGMNNLVAFVSLAAITSQCLHVSCDKDIIRHLLAVSSAAALLAEHVKGFAVKREVATIAGLLHDVGKPLLYITMPNEYLRIKHYALKENKTYYETEEELLGFNHCIVGSILAKKWKLPHIYKETIRNHHDDKIKDINVQEDDVLCYLVRIADAMANETERGLSPTKERHVMDLLGILGIEKTRYQEINKNIREIGKIDI